MVHGSLAPGAATRDGYAGAWANPGTSISGRRVARELTDLISRRDKPDMIVSDHGTEFTSNAIPAWTKDHRVEWRSIAPAKPIQNGHVESFNGRQPCPPRQPERAAMDQSHNG
jgi:transposase InsO family protein